MSINKTPKSNWNLSFHLLSTLPVKLSVVLFHTRKHHFKRKWRYVFKFKRFISSYILLVIISQIGTVHFGFDIRCRRLCCSPGINWRIYLNFNQNINQLKLNWIKLIYTGRGIRGDIRSSSSVGWSWNSVHRIWRWCQQRCRTQMYQLYSLPNHLQDSSS